MTAIYGMMGKMRRNLFDVNTLNYAKTGIVVRHYGSACETIVFFGLPGPRDARVRRAA